MQSAEAAASARRDASCAVTNELDWAGDIAVELDIVPYFDRVSSESNPVDGISRERLQGPWQR